MGGCAGGDEPQRGWDPTPGMGLGGTVGSPPQTPAHRFLCGPTHLPAHRCFSFSVIVMDVEVWAGFISNDTDKTPASSAEGHSLYARHYALSEITTAVCAALCQMFCRHLK